MRLPPFLLALLCLLPWPARALDDPAQAVRLVQLGAPDLALHLARAALEKNPGHPAWRDAYWQAAAQSRRAADPSLPAPDAQSNGAAWAGYRLTLARQAAARADWSAARRQWALALWQGELAPAEASAVQQAIAQSWLAPGQNEAEAELINPILLRLAQDAPGQPALVETAALRLLDLQQAQGALELLDARAPHSPLLALAQLQLGRITPQEAEVRLRAGSTGASAAAAWQGLLRLAEQRNAADLRVEALEALLGLGVAPERHAFALWQAYQVLAESAANRRQLLVGMEAAWLEQARQALQENPLEGRALLAWLAQHGSDPAWRLPAIEALVEALSQPPGLRAPRLLGTAPALPRLPEALRYRLGEQARAGGDHALAAAWWQGLPASVSTLPARTWYLAQAEINARAGRARESLQWLQHALAPGEPMSPEQGRAALDQVRQRVRQGQLEPAAALAQQLLARVTPAGQAPVWQLLGEISELRGQWAEAAAQHLLSATGSADSLPARARAARNLERAGLHDDAARQTRLLQTADAPGGHDAAKP